MDAAERLFAKLRAVEQDASSVEDSAADPRDPDSDGSQAGGSSRSGSRFGSRGTSTSEWASGGGPGGGGGDWSLDEVEEVIAMLSDDGEFPAPLLGTERFEQQLLSHSAPRSTPEARKRPVAAVAGRAPAQGSHGAALDDWMLAALEHL